MYKVGILIRREEGDKVKHITIEKRFCSCRMFEGLEEVKRIYWYGTNNQKNHLFSEVINARKNHEFP